MSDKIPLYLLYKKVATQKGRLAMEEDEITEEYIDEMLMNGTQRGLALVIERDKAIIGSMIKYRSKPRTLSHVLLGGSILIDSDYQGKGLGTALIRTFLDQVERDFPNILRVEIIARESNPAIRLYQRVGFKPEGRFEKRIKGAEGEFEADIPMVWMNPGYRVT